MSVVIQQQLMNLEKQPSYWDSLSMNSKINQKKKKFQLRAFFPSRHSCELFQETEEGSGSQGSGSCCSMVQFSVAPFFSHVAAEKSKHGRVKFHFYNLPSFYVFKASSPLNFVSGLLSKWMALKNTPDLEKVPLKKKLKQQTTHLSS